MLKFCSLASGSKGNALLIKSQECCILIDNGLSFRQLTTRLTSIGLTPYDLHGIFITHEHEDHTKGLEILCHNLRIPIFMTEGTYVALKQLQKKLDNVCLFEPGENLFFRDLEVNSFSISHDAIEPVNYIIGCNGAKLGIATDLGFVSTLVLSRLRGSNALLIEANHCPKMLYSGKYPPFLKQRIASKRGHLSNFAMSQLLKQVLHEKLRLVILAHLSEENNKPEIALKVAQQILKEASVQLYVAYQHSPTPIFEISQ